MRGVSKQWGKRDAYNAELVRIKLHFKALICTLQKYAMNVSDSCLKYNEINMRREKLAYNF